MSPNDGTLSNFTTYHLAQTIVVSLLKYCKINKDDTNAIKIIPANINSNLFFIFTFQYHHR